MARRVALRDNLPTLDRETVLRFITENPTRATKRDLAKAFSVKGHERVLLKDILADLAAEGVIAGGRKQYSAKGALPTMAVLRVSSRDDEGGLVAEAVSWDEEANGEPPLFRLKQSGDGKAAGIGDRALCKLDFESEDGPLARVVRILDADRSVALGIFRQMPGGGGRVEPVEKRGVEYAISPDDAKGARNGDLVEVETVSRPKAGFPRGRIGRVVGEMASEGAISTIALHAHSIPHVFPKSVLDEADAVRQAGPASREDWRDLALVTIDPRDAKDHDDAVHAAPDDDPANPDGFVATVAIADVSFFVRPGTRLDAEARLRGNSVYFPDRVVPMLPERISNDLCSLREHEDRAAIAVRMRFAADGRKIGHSFHRIMMRSHAKLPYELAQSAVDGATDEVDPAIVAEVLKPLFDAYRRLKAARDARQPLDLDLPERKLVLGPDGRVERVVVPQRLDAHRLIEEFMIQANVAAAETLEAKRQALVYRTHDSPSLAKLESLRDFLKTLDIPLAKAGTLRPSHFNGILGTVRGTEHESLVNEVVLRSQSQAVYDVDNIGHFGLSLARYAHFTSPIRRYADLLVHRALVSALGLGDGGLSRDDEERLKQTAEEISGAERRAMAAERDTVDRLIAHHLADRVGADFSGRITGVTRAGLFVRLPEYGADGFVPISTLGRDYYHHDEAGHALVGERTRAGFRLGDIVDVRLVEAVPLAGAMRFEILTEPRELPVSRASFHKSQPKFRRGPGRDSARQGRRRP